MKLSYSTSIAFVILLNILISIFVLSLPFKAKLYGDIAFHEEAKIVASIIKGESNFDDLELKRAPAPSIFYGIAYSFVEDNDDHSFWKAGVIFNLLIINLSSLLLVASYLKIAGNRFLWVPVTMLFIIPVQLYYGMGIIAETLAFFATSIITYGVLNIIQQPNNSSKLITGIGMLLLVFARPNAILVFILPLVFAILLIIVNYKKYKYFFSHILITALATTTVFFFVTFIIKNIPTNQNKTNQENYILLVLQHGRFQFRTEELDWRFWDNENRPDSKDYISYVECNRVLQNRIKEENKTYKEVYQEWVINDILNNPLTFLKQAMIRVFFGNVLQINSVNHSKFSVAGFNGKFVYYLFHIILNLVNVTLIVLAGMGILKLQKIKKEYWILVTPYLALIFFHMFIYMEQRYLFPARIIIVLLASYSISKIIERYKASNIKSNSGE